MVTPAKRTSYITGSLILALGFWTLLQFGFLHTNNLNVGRAFQPGLYHKDISATHSPIHSLSTWNGEFFSIEMGGEPALNPNIIPHPVLDDTWILVAQLRQETQYFAELVCTARFHGNVLKCINGPSKLPIAPTFGDKCTGDLAYFSLNQGPHDARVFYGPRAPYTIYGSNSGHTCFGQWVQDFRNLMEWGYDLAEFPGDFSAAVEIQRPLPWSSIEKNWFLFWDIDGEMYVHHDLVPDRVFARVESTGAVGPDMGSITRTDDQICMSRFMPPIAPKHESIHQATNSLSLTMCRREDISCIPDTSNTFIFTIFQHKKYYNFHAVYEPYVLIFEQSPPFKVHAISTKPLWISGRRLQAAQASPLVGSGNTDFSAANLTTPTEQMLYVTSMSWRNKQQKYHGYMDDTIFIAFGIEDEETAAIDVMAADLVQNLGFC